MRANFLLTAAAVGAVAQASTIYVSSYTGQVYTFDLTGSDLTKSDTNSDCGIDPSWLVLDKDNKALFCLNEGITTPNGSITSYNIEDDASLDMQVTVISPLGPVSGVMYKSNNATVPTGMAVAHYFGSEVSSWKTSGADLSIQQNFFYTLPEPGPVPDRQEAPHEHEAILDPTGKFVIVPDLGADLVRVFSINDQGELTPQEPLTAAPGSGPRHAAFWSPTADDCDSPQHRKYHRSSASSPTYLFLVSELVNTVTGYEVTYNADGTSLSFSQVSETSSFGPNDAPAGAAVAEIAVSPDNKFVVVSNRGDQSVTMPNPDPSGPAQIDSDSLITFTPNADGSLTFEAAAGAGGSFPRQFALNAKGDRVAVGLQYSESLVILDRDIETGKIGDAVAFAGNLGNVTCAQWYE